MLLQLGNEHNFARHQPKFGVVLPRSWLKTNENLLRQIDISPMNFEFGGYYPTLSFQTCSLIQMENHFVPFLVFEIYLPP